MMYYVSGALLGNTTDAEMILYGAAKHPAISECCVPGLRDKTYGEAITAIIVPNMEIKTISEKDLEPAITLDELSSWAKQKHAPYKVSDYNHCSAPEAGAILEDITPLQLIAYRMRRLTTFSFLVL